MKNTKETFKNQMYYMLPPNDKVKWYKIQVNDRRNSRLLWKDPESGIARPLRYVANMQTPFSEEQDQSGSAMIREDVVFEHGIFGTDQANLQDFLSKHPGNKVNGGSLFYKYDPFAEAEDEIDVIELQHKAVSAALDLDTDIMEVVMRPTMGEAAFTVTSKELKRETLNYAKENPQTFLDAVNSTLLFNLSVAYKAVDLNLLNIQGGRTVTWSKTGDFLLDIPFGKDQFEYIAYWFDSDDGQKVLDTISKILAPKKSSKKDK